MSNMGILNMLRRGAAVALLAGAVSLAGCRDALTVSNPKVIETGDLANAQLIGTLLNSAVFAVNTNYSEFAWYSAIITDEALNATNDYRSGELSQRIVELAQGNVGPYPLLQFTRATADTSASLIRTLVKQPAGDLRLARALAYAGYGYVFLAEFTCTAPINGGPLVSDDSLEKIALARFKEAITDATPADNGGTKAVADTILALANVGAARASLNLGDKASAISYASAVPANFVIWADYIAAPPALNNTLWGRISGQNKQLGVHPLMQNLHDPCVRYVTQAVL